MKKLKTSVPILFLAILAAILVLLALWPRSKPTKKVVVAAHDLPAGTLLTAADLQVQPLLTSMIPSDALVKPDPLIGRPLSITLLKGEPVTFRFLSTSTTLKPDERGISVAVNKTTGGAGLIRPGMVVDVIATLKGEQALRFGTTAWTVLQNVRVLYVPETFQSSAYQQSKGTANISAGQLITSKAPPPTSNSYSSGNKGTIVLAAKTKIQPIYTVPAEDMPYLAKGILTVLPSGVLTTTKTITDTRLLAKLQQLPMPQVSYVVPAELLAALNAMGSSFTLAITPPHPKPYLAIGLALDALMQPINTHYQPVPTPQFRSPHALPSPTPAKKKKGGGK